MKNNESPQVKISPFRKLLFGLLFFSLILVGLEFVLSFAGLEKYDSIFMPKSSYPIFVPGKGDMADYYVTNPHFGTYMNRQSFLKIKPSGLTRIFVVGGSAAYGYPCNEEYGFSGYLRRALDKAAPGRFEVVNAAGMSFGSHRVLDVLKDVVRFEPDIVIIYSGNNEYVEKNILPEMKTPSTVLAKISSVLDRTDIYRAVRLGLYKIAPRVFERRIKKDITDIRANPDVSRGNIGRSAETDSEILANYKHNIGAMRDVLVQQGVKVILCTVPVDIGGWIPDSGLPQFADKKSADKWMELVQLREGAYKKGDTSLEAEYMRQILTITPGDPGMLFNYGKVLWSLGDYKDSYRELEKAKDLDYRPIRALSSFNATIRSAAESGGNGVHLADLENRVRELFLRGQAKGIFFDYCHLTEAGHKLVAQWLLPLIKEDVISPQLDLNQLAGFIRVDKRAAEKSDSVRGYELYAQAMTFENNKRYDLAEKNYFQALKYLPEFDHIYTNLGHIYANRGELGKAVEMYNKSLSINPKNHMTLLSLGYISLQEGKFDQAEDIFNRVIDITSDLPGAYGGLGDVAMHRKKYDLAVKYYTDSLRMGQDSVWLRSNLAQAYLALGDKASALRNWKEALKYSPFDTQLQDEIKKYSK